MKPCSFLHNSYRPTIGSVILSGQSLENGVELFMLVDKIDCGLSKTCPRLLRGDVAD